MEIDEQEYGKKIMEAVQTTVEAYQRYQKENIVIVDKKTKAKIEECEMILIDNPKSFMRDYVFPDLEKIGLKFELEEPKQ